jgi:hypothetical protein
MISLDKALDDIMKMDFSTRELLLEILRKRMVEEKRKTFASNAKKARSAFSKGKLKPQSADEIIRDLDSIS